MQAVRKITRLSYNSKGWQRPTGEARKYEAAGTYNNKYGFGHEDWLFRDEWRVDGWRYAFLEGVNKSHAALAGRILDLTLFTIEPSKKRRYVAEIDNVEVLDDRQAEDALEEFRQRGWHATMRREAEEAGGNASALGAPEWAKHVLNIRFRVENVRRFPAGSYAGPDDPILGFKRYMLYNDPEPASPATSRKLPRRSGTSTPPATGTVRRRAVASVEYTPEHARMQAKLMQELEAVYPQPSIRREEDFVDVSVRTATELLLFEIKSDLDPRMVIRQALGQLLEYAYHPIRHRDLPLKLVIVGRSTLTDKDAEYLTRLKTDFQLPITYRKVVVA